MRFSWSRAVLCVVAVLAVCGALSPATAADEAAEVVLSERYREVLHGGVATAANTVVTCGAAVSSGAPPCAETQGGGPARSADYETAYVDVDADPNTYNSSRADLELPPGARVTHARLYWGANIRVGEQKPPADNARVLIAEPGGAYKEVIADSVVGHRDTDAYEGFAASADVTELVRDSRPGSYTVGQVNVAMGHSATGGWGGWALVAAYQDADEPLRELAILDGYEALDGDGQSTTVTVEGLRTEPGGSGSAGVVAFGGERGRTGESFGARGDAGPVVPLGDAANPAHDVMNSTISRHGRDVAGREPGHVNTLGFDADVFDLSPALTEGPRRLELRFGSGGDGYQLGAVFLQAEARR